MHKISSLFHSSFHMLEEFPWAFTNGKEKLFSKLSSLYSSMCLLRDCSHPIWISTADFPTELLCLPLTRRLLLFFFFSRNSFRLDKPMLNTKSILWGNCSPSLMSDSCPLSKYCPCSTTQVIDEKIESHFGWDRHLWLSTSSCSGSTPPVSTLTGGFTQKFHPNEALLPCFWEVTQKKWGLCQAFFLHCSYEDIFT